jgi:membrane protease subunit HflC
VLDTPGLYFKLPAPMQTKLLLDRRIQTIDSDEADRYTTLEKKDVLVDTFIKWKIVDAKVYYLAFKGDHASASSSIAQMVRTSLTEAFAKESIKDIVANQREPGQVALIADVSARTQKEYGIGIVDIRLKRINLPPEISEAVYRRMQAERSLVANRMRSQGSAEAEQIKADADREREVILADANQKAQGIMGDGDAQASQIYAEAYGRDPGFYDFYKSLEAYRESFKDRRDVLVLDPSSDFFKYLKSPGVGPVAAPARH